MRLDDEAVRVAIGLRLGLELCVPYQCHCRAQVDSFGRHAFVCQKGRRQINSASCSKQAGIIARALSASAILDTKEPQGLCRSDGKRPDGLTLVPWQSGRSLVWDVTVVCHLENSCVASAAREAKSVAELAATEKEDMFIPTNVVQLSCIGNQNGVKTFRNVEIFLTDSYAPPDMEFRTRRPSVRKIPLNYI